MILKHWGFMRFVGNFFFVLFFQLELKKIHAYPPCFQSITMWGKSYWQSSSVVAFIFFLLFLFLENPAKAARRCVYFPSPGNTPRCDSIIAGSSSHLRTLNMIRSTVWGHYSELSFPPLLFFRVAPAHALLLLPSSPPTPFSCHNLIFPHNPQSLIGASVCSVVPIHRRVGYGSSRFRRGVKCLLATVQVGWGGSGGGFFFSRWDERVPSLPSCLPKPRSYSTASFIYLF